MELAARNEMVMANLPLVGYLASELCAKATHLSREDMVSVGTIAMISASESFDPSFGVPFGAYARRRILGAFADEMRAGDWATRGARKKITQTRSIQDTLTAALGRQPSTAELSAALGVNESEVRSVLADADRTVVALDETMYDYLESGQGTPEGELLDREHRQIINHAIESLPEKMRILIQRLYFEGATVKQIAAESGVTHSAVSQQRSAAMKLLHEALQSNYLTEKQPLPEARLTKSAALRREQYLVEFSRRAMGKVGRKLDTLLDDDPAVLRSPRVV